MTKVIYKTGANGAQALRAVSASEDGSQVLFRKEGAPSRLAADQIASLAIDFTIIFADYLQQRGADAAAYFGAPRAPDHSSAITSNSRHMPRRGAKIMCSRLAR